MPSTASTSKPLLQASGLADLVLRTASNPLRSPRPAEKSSRRNRNKWLLSPTYSWLSYLLPLACHAFAWRGVGYPHCARLLGRKVARTAMIYAHVLRRGGKGVRSLAELLNIGRIPVCLCSLYRGFIGN